MNKYKGLFININYMISIYINFICTYTIVSIITLFIDLYPKYSKYLGLTKKSKSIKEVINIVKKTYKTVFMNVFIYSIPFIYISIYFLNLKNKTFSYSDTVKDLFISYYLIDIFFYFTHYLLHTKYLYKFHKKHHEIKEPIGMTALYAHIVDYYFSNLIPVLLPMVILSSTYVTVHIWVFLSILNTIFESHTSYENLSDFHLNHHKYFNYNYGTGGRLDILLDTHYDYRNK
jgi:sterol desaturase/sphingolipid hydroxylase (fatty acid hydroxylase superfamily)